MDASKVVRVLEELCECARVADTFGDIRFPMMRDALEHGNQLITDLVRDDMGSRVHVSDSVHELTHDRERVEWYTQDGMRIGCLKRDKDGIPLLVGQSIECPGGCLVIHFREHGVGNPTMTEDRSQLSGASLVEQDPIVAPASV